MFVQTTLFSQSIPEETNIQQQEYIADSNGNLQQFDAPTNQTLTSSNYDYAYIDSKCLEFWKTRFFCCC